MSGTRAEAPSDESRHPDPESGNPCQTIVLGGGSDAVGLTIDLRECVLPAGGSIFIGANAPSSRVEVACNEIDAPVPSDRAAIRIEGPATGDVAAIVQSNEVRGNFAPAAILVMDHELDATAHVTAVLASNVLVGDAATVLEHPLLDDTPCAIPIVSATAQGATANARPVRVQYSTGLGRWTIVNQDGTPMPAGVVFHVLVNPAQVLACRPWFTDGFESGDTTAWSGVVP